MTSSSSCRARSRLSGRTGSRFSSLQTREQLELDVVDERSALQRVELIDRVRHLARRKAMNGLKKEAVGAARIVLKRGRRIAPGVERVLRHDRPDRGPID